MKKNIVAANFGGVSGRITRSRAAALGCASSDASKRDQTSSNSDSTTFDVNSSNAANSGCIQRKRKAVLQDVTNIRCNSTAVDCFTSIKGKSSKQARKAPAHKPVCSVPVEIPKPQGISRAKIDGKVVRKEQISEKTLGTNKLDENTVSGSRTTDRPQDDSEKSRLDGDKMITRSQDVLDIDSDKKDPLLCTIYAPDIYKNLRVAELVRRPNCGFMETVQRDITKNMRGILIDWLVEVSEEYNLAPDTLYITVYLIDLYLFQHYIERQRLQLLGITSMLIASKYEEFCPPRVDELCFMTDNTYTREEVLKMEVHLLNYLGFRISSPTTQSFLRRFLRAAQASYPSPCVELEYMANYLAELTLINCDFLSFLPSVVAASAVFLAKWTLDDSQHPWNPTLEYYTQYKVSDLKTAVLALQDLQMNAKGCTLTAIRTRYQHQKYRSVAGVSSKRVPETLF